MSVMAPTMNTTILTRKSMCMTSVAGTAGTFVAASMDQSAYDRAETSLITRPTMEAAGANTGKEKVVGIERVCHRK